MRPFVSILSLLLLLTSHGILRSAETTGDGEVRKALEAAILADGDDQLRMIADLADTGAPIVAEALTAWRRGEYFSYGNPVTGETRVGYLDDASDPYSETGVGALATGAPMVGNDGAPLRLAPFDVTALFPSREARAAISRAVDLVALNAKSPAARAEAARKLGLKQEQKYYEVLQVKAETEQDPKVRKALREAMAVTGLALGEKDEILESVEVLREVHSIAGLEFLKRLQKAINAGETQIEFTSAERDQIAKAIASIERYISVVDFVGTFFRGMSLGSVLLVVALGLAITFGLMGVINMAHGEMIAIGAYAAYLTETCMAAWFPASKMAFELYFLLAIPLSFIMAATTGVLLERCVIRFLYRRPLESLLATWGISLIMQQGFRLIFGAANRQVNSPSWLQGSVQISDVALSYNRIFVILFAILIVIGVLLLIKKTSLGLSIRAVMQNPAMAASMGIRTDRVRMVTFALGSGLAGLAGVFLSQIGSVGPNLGQNYIVDSFMVVVAGGVGNILGTVFSALGIGIIDQTLQPMLGPVMGRILVLVGIILFLQWKPDGLFPTRSRSLD